MSRKRDKDSLGNWSTRSNFSKPVNMPDVGAFVKREIYELEMTIPALGRRLSIPPPRAYRMLDRKDWRVSEIMNVSTVIGNNIFAWYADQTQPPQPAVAAQPSTAQTPEAEMQNLRLRNAVLENENRLLREMVDMLKSR